MVKVIGSSTFMHHLLLMITFLVFVLFFSWILHRYNPKMVLVRPVHEFYLNKVHYQNQVGRKEFGQIDRFLEKNNGFYRNLSIDGRAKFIHRMEEFIADKSFVGSHGLVIQDQHRWLIASGAIMITFGSDDYIYRNVREIMVFPQEFFHPALKRKLKGGSSRYQVLLSWNNTVLGFEDDNDALNLAIHEFAHAFEFTLKHYPSTHKRFRSYSILLDDIAEGAFHVIRNEQPDVFRKYAQTNRKEFFAVALEYFFEQPEHFVQSFPELYAHLAVALNLNPLNKEKDYILDKKFVEGMNRSLRKKAIPDELSTMISSTSDWPQWAIAIGFLFCGPIAMILLSNFQEVPDYVAWMWPITSIIVAGFAYQKYLKSDYMSLFVFVAYTSFGVAPIILSAFMALNFLVVSNRVEKTLMMPIVIANKYTDNVFIENREDTDFNCDYMNPFYLGKGFIKQNEVSVGDSMQISVYEEEHFPGWIMYNGFIADRLKYN
jgi:Mlc titration factor MtfA (ptsG expression regulator)